jgi:hypothetical protein
MTIKFICTCGKHLKARDEMAARRSVCPRCGSPVGIPSLRPTHPGTVAAPLTPLERQRLARERAASSSALVSPQADSLPPPPRPADTGLVRLLSPRGNRDPALVGRPLEAHWYECLLYPLRARRLCLGLALFLTLCSAWMALFLPHLLEEAPVHPWAQVVVGLIGVLSLVLIVGLPCSFLDCVLTSAAAGEVYYLRWSGNLALAVLVSGARWLLCFLAGPIIFAALAWLYWLNCGDPGWLDVLILTELGLVGFAYWIFALLAVTDRGRLRDLNPVAVVDLAHRLGRRGLFAVAVAALLLLAFGWALIVGAAGVQNRTFQGWWLLGGGWVGVLLTSTFFCRLLGLWCYRTRSASEPARDATTIGRA